MSFDGLTADTSELTLGMASAVTSAMGFIYDTDASGSVVHTTDCAGDYYGSAVEDASVVFVMVAVLLMVHVTVMAMFLIATMNAVAQPLNSCGVCGGAGRCGHDCDGNCIDSDTCGEVVLSFANATDSSVDVMYSSSVALVVQFTVDGVSLRRPLQ